MINVTLENVCAAEVLSVDFMPSIWSIPQKHLWIELVHVQRGRVEKIWIIF